MKKQIIHGEGVQGMCLTLNVCDMFVASQMAEELARVRLSRSTIKEYDKCAYDERKERFPNGRPEQIEMTDESLERLQILMFKMSLNGMSTMFEAEDEQEDNGPL